MIDDVLPGTDVIQEVAMTGTIQNRVSDILGQKGMTIRDFEKAADLSYGTAWALYHRKTSQITFDVLAKICAALNVQVGDLLVYVPYEESNVSGNGDTE